MSPSVQATLTEIRRKKESHECKIEKEQRLQEALKQLRKKAVKQRPAIAQIISPKKFADSDVKAAKNILDRLIETKKARRVREVASIRQVTQQNYEK